MASVSVGGIGLISPYGNNKEAFWEFLLNPDSDFDLYETADTMEGAAGKKYLCKRIKDFSATSYYDAKNLHKFDRNSELSVSAAKLAIEDSGVNMALFDESERDVCLGTFVSIGSPMSDFDESVFTDGPRRCDIGSFPSTVMSAPASRISILNSMKGLNVTFCSGRNSGLDAVGYSFMRLKSSSSGLIFAGGSEALSDKILYGLHAESMLFTKDHPADKRRSSSGSIIPSEGAGILVLESGETRLPKSYCQIAAFVPGFNVSKRIDVINRSKKLSSIIGSAIREAGLSPSDMGLVILSSYFSPIDLEVEMASLRDIFSSDLLRKIPFISYKDRLGESFSLNGVLQVITAVGFFCGTLNNKNAHHLNVNPDFQKGKVSAKHALLISVDPAGHNSALVLSATEGA